MHAETHEAAGVATRALAVVLGLPDHDLTLNRRGGNEHARAKLVWAHKGAATLAALMTVPDESRPYFPAGVQVVAWCSIERRKRGQRWDFGAVVEACKPYFDGFNGIVWADDKQLMGMVVVWDERPTGQGIIKIKLTEV